MTYECGRATLARSHDKNEIQTGKRYPAAALHFAHPPDSHLVASDLAAELPVVAQQLQLQRQAPSSQLQTPVSQQQEPSAQQTAQEQSLAGVCD